MFSRIQMQHMDGLCIFNRGRNMKFAAIFKLYLTIYLVCSPAICFGEKASDKSSTIGQLIPPGMMLYYAGCKSSGSGTCNDAGKIENVPEGWIKAYGQAVSRSLYPKLFAAIGTTYGLGNGSSTFNLPDCRGRDIVGRDNMGGAAKGLITISGQDGRGVAVGNFGIVIGGSGGVSSTEPTSATGTQTYTFPKHYHGFSLNTNPTGSHTHSVEVASNTGSHLHDVSKMACPPTSDGDLYLLGTQCSSPTDTTSVLSGIHGHPSSSITISGSGTHTHTVSGAVGYHGAGSINGDVDTSGVSFPGHFHSTVGSVVQPSIVMNCIIKY